MDEVDLAIAREIEQMTADQIDWLRGATPDEWHCFALDYNWNEPLEPLMWIVSQPACDKATALTIFWRGEPTHYLLMPEYDDEKGEAAEIRAMQKLIVRRLYERSYSRAEIAFDAIPMMLTDYRDLVRYDRDAAPAEPTAHPDMIASIRGREVRVDYTNPGAARPLVASDMPDDVIVTPFLKTARFEASCLMVNLVVAAFAMAFLAQYGGPKQGYVLAWTVGVGAIGYCLYSALGSLRLIRALMRSEERFILPSWLYGAIAASLLFGVGASLLFWQWLLDDFQQMIAAYGTVVVALATLIIGISALWGAASAVAPVVIGRRSLR